MEPSQRTGSQNLAELRYVEDTRTIELLVPKGTQLVDLAGKIPSILKSDILSELPRGCQTCTSGDNWLVREYLEERVNPSVLIDLDSVEVIRGR